MTSFASLRMIEFLSALPEIAFSMAGDVSNDFRFLFTYAPPGTHGARHGTYARVLYRYGWLDQSPWRVAVLFVLPPSPGYGQEVLVIHIHVAAWGTLGARAWRRMLLRCLPMGISDFPVMEG